MLYIAVKLRFITFLLLNPQSFHFSFSFPPFPIPIFSWAQAIVHYKENVNLSTRTTRGHRDLSRKTFMTGTALQSALFLPSVSLF